MEVLKNMTLEQRQEFVKNHADVVEEGTYFKPFSKDELTATQSEFSDLSVQVYLKEVELKALSDRMKDEIKKLKKKQGELLESIQFNGENVDGEQFGFADQETGTMAYYDNNGSFIRSRRLKPEERQKTIFQLARTAND